MPVLSAHDVAAELRRRLPGIGTKKLHKLLYYCQGHHLATFGLPLFHESVMAWDMGPVVGTLWKQEQETETRASGALGEPELNTVGYVVSRYGALSGNDLERLTHNEKPWLEANAHRLPHTSTKISNDVMRDFFRSVDADEDDEQGLVFDTDDVSALLQEAAEDKTAAARDSLVTLHALLTGD